MFDLSKSLSEDSYSRNGYNGSYFIQKEDDGSYSLFYSGGLSPEGFNVGPKTYLNGAWDSTRKTRK